MQLKWNTPQLILGLVFGSLLTGLVLNIKYTKELLEAIQALTITLAALFTAFWTSKTFAHKARTEEVKEIAEVITRVENNLLNLAIARVRMDFNEETNQNIHNEETKECLVIYDLCIRHLDNMLSNAMYISPQFKIERITLLPMDITAMQLIENYDLKKKVTSIFTDYKYRLLNSTYFNLNAEWRRFRNYVQL